MIELPFVFCAGILGAGHCLGMCGPFALAIGASSSNWPSALGRQMAYTAGRLFTYAVLGATAGYLGERAVHQLPHLVSLPAWIAVAAGLLLIFQGLASSGMLGRRALPSGTGSCLAGGLLRPFFSQPGWSGVFIAGLFTGLLPCGLLYGMLALAFSSHSIAWGAATMTAFGLGTAPPMMMAGMGGRLLGLVARRRLYAVAACGLLVAGGVSVVRGVSYLAIGGTPTAGCPFCSH
jgi:sulfite exporter TauE/SafE